MATLVTSALFSAWAGGIGIYRPQAVEDALMMAETEAEKWLSTALVPTSTVEEFPWPIDFNRVMLKKVRLISITSVESMYSDGECGWNTGDECSTIFDARQAIIRIRDPWQRWCCGSRCPERIRVTYQYGFTSAESNNTTHEGHLLHMIIYNAAVGFLQIGGGLNAQGNIFITSYTAAGYSESRQGQEISGAENIVNQYIQLAKSLARRLEVKRPIEFRSRHSATRSWY